MPDARELLSIRQAVERLPHLTPGVLRGMLDRHELPCIFIDGRVYVAEPDLRAHFGPLFQ